jgi:hypothetical protein
MSERSPAELILAHQKRIDEYNGEEPDSATALGCCDQSIATSWCRCRRECAQRPRPFRTRTQCSPQLRLPRLTRMTSQRGSNRAIMRSGKLIEAKAVETPQPE